jgi:hypothetical protein
VTTVNGFDGRKIVMPPIETPVLTQGAAATCACARAGRGRDLLANIV